MTTFATMLKDNLAGAEMVPTLMAMLHNPDFSGFTVKIRGHERRAPDGWFHPSTHPLMSERQLYYYLVQPQRWLAEVFDPTSTLTCSAGDFWEAFMGHLLSKAGILVARNIPVEDPECGSKGSTDGRLVSGKGWECKSIRPEKLRRLAEGPPADPQVIASFRDLLPKYYVQATEYLRMTRWTHMAFLFVSTSWPHQLREVHLPYDHILGHQIKQKYLNVRKAVEAGAEPAICCAPKSKEAKFCPARLACPIGTM